jgi:thymidylate synthase (FAD)
MWFSGNLDQRCPACKEPKKQEEKIMTDKIEVLNGGYIRLVDHMGGDLSVVRSARVSYDAGWREPELDEVIGKDAKLIAYLLKNKHTSPFESVTFTFEVKAPIFVYRQWHRHRTWAYNEVSARYTELDMGFYIPALADINQQHASNKQMRTDEQHPEAQWIQTQMYSSIMRSYKTYLRLLNKGTARELARIVLPVAMYSKMFATVNLHNLLHFLTLRAHTHSQKEIRVYAEAILQLIEPIVPVTIKNFNELRGEK